MSKFTLRSAMAVVLSTAALATQLASACGTEPFIGEICPFGFTFCPNGYLPADGRLLSISQNTALFSLYGTTYGGNGQTTFGLPDLRGRTAVNTGQGPGLSNITLGQLGGSESTTLTSQNMPQHTHSATTSVTVTPSVNVSTSVGASSSPGGNVLAGSSTRDNLYASAPNGQMAANAVSAPASATTNIGPAGGNQPFSVRSPFLGITYCIAIQGIFPSRP